ncbi:MAG: hypothetical protein ACJ74Y_11820 [Bryobacteraceae bacterium]
MRRLLVGLLMSGILLLPVQAQYKSYRTTNDRYYDRDHKDYHSWNDGESKAWRRYWQEQRRREIAWERANARQKREYWKWRHDRMDR